MQDLYSITGFMFEGSRGINYFGGFLIAESGPEGLSSPFKGQSNDNWGRADLVGHLNSQTIIFEKNYPRRGTKYSYSLEKNSQGIWIGQYKSVNSQAWGDVICKIHKDWEKANILDCQGQPALTPTNWETFIQKELADAQRLINVNGSGVEDVFGPVPD